MYLLDTNVVSTARRIDRAPVSFATWLENTSTAEMYLSSVTIFELELGRARIARRDSEQASVLHDWLAEDVLPTFSQRILPFDTGAARRCAAMHVPDPRPTLDAMIAATALEHGLILVTRNVRDFQPLGVPLLNPWDAADAQ